MSEEEQKEELHRYGKCLIEREIGRGARSVVYLAWHEGLQIPVAVKVMKKQREEPEEQYSERFMREARIAAQLTHPNIVRVYDCGETEDSYYLVLEYIEGESCRDRMAGGVGFDWQSAARLIRAVADGLNHAAKKGIIHRDLKPENIMIDSEGKARIADLGLAKEAGAVMSSTTAEGDVLGTPYYMSPEQVRQPRDVDFRSDIYSLGATLYHMATGDVPFEAPTPFEIMTMHLNNPLPPPHEKNPDLPEALCDIITRAMAKEPQNRYQNYPDLIRDLDAVLEERTETEEGSMVPVEEALADTAFEPPGPEAAAEPQQQEEETPTPPPAEPAAAAAPKRLPRTVRPTQLPVTAHNVRAKTAAALALIAYVFLIVALYHGALSLGGLAAATGVAAAMVGVSFGMARMRLRRQTEQPRETEAAHAVAEQISTALGWTCERLDLPVPVLRITRGDHGQPQAYGFFSTRAVLYLPGGWLGRTMLDGVELRAYLARGLSDVYDGNADLRTLLAVPVGLLNIAGGVSRFLLRLPGLRPASRWRLHRGLGVFSLLAACAVVGVLLHLWIPAGAIAALLFAVLALTASFQRHCQFTADEFASAVVEDEEAVKSLAALSALTGPERYPLLRESLGSDAPASDLIDREGQGYEKGTARALAEHYAGALYIPDTLELALKLFDHTPNPAERLNNLGEVPEEPSLAEIVLGWARTGLAALAGRSERHFVHVLDLGGVRLYAFVGTVAGVLAALSAVVLGLLTGASFAKLLAATGAIGLAVGLLTAHRARRTRLPTGAMGWAVVVAGLFMTLATMLVLCLTFWPTLAGYALQFPLILALALVSVAFATLLYGWVAGKLGVRAPRTPVAAGSRTAHTVMDVADERLSILRSRAPQTERKEPRQGKPTEGA